MPAANATAKKVNDTVVVDADVQAKTGAADADAVINLAAVRRPFYAYVGVADLAVEKLRELPVKGAQLYANTVGGVQGQVNEAREGAKAIPTVAAEQLKALPGKAKDVYGDLVVRGQRLVETVRNNPDARTALAEAKAAVKEARDAAVHAKRSAKAGANAAEETAEKVG